MNKPNAIPQNIEIGQVVFFIHKKLQAVVPALVTEETVKRTKDGVQVSYVVVVGGDKNKTTMNLDSLSDNVFSSLQEVEAHLRQKLETTISQSVQKASDWSLKWYGKDLSSASMMLDSNEQFIQSELKTENVGSRMPADPLDGLFLDETDYSQHQTSEQTGIVVKLPNGQEVPVTTNDN